MTDRPADKLPRRDFVLLPLIVGLTILLLWGGAELLARTLFSADEAGACRIADPVLGYRNRPNCTETLKAAEAGRVTNSFNDCGYRTAESCGPKPVGSLRIALIGSSIAEGHLVDYDNSLGYRIGTVLTRQCHRPVEVQNLAAAYYFLDQIEQRGAEALRLQPDLLMWALTPFDVQVGQDMPPTFHQVSRAPVSLLVRLHSALLDSRAFMVLQHFYYEDDAAYVRLFLLNRDKAGFLFTRYSPEWQSRVKKLNVVVAAVAQKAAAAGVPFVLVFLPQRAQAILPHLDVPFGVDPYALNRATEKIAVTNGARFIDTMPDLEKEVTDPGRLFLPVDGHLDARGHALVGASIARQLIESGLGAFGPCHQTASDAQTE